MKKFWKKDTFDSEHIADRVARTLRFKLAVTQYDFIKNQEKIIKSNNTGRKEVTITVSMETPYFVNLQVSTIYRHRNGESTVLDKKIRLSTNDCAFEGSYGVCYMVKENILSILSSHNMSIRWNKFKAFFNPCNWFSSSKDEAVDRDEEFIKEFVKIEEDRKERRKMLHFDFKPMKRIPFEYWYDSNWFYPEFQVSCNDISEFKSLREEDRLPYLVAKNYNLGQIELLLDFIQY